VSFAISDGVSQVLHAALDGLQTRQDVISNNIANVDTANFRATSVDFESALQDAISSGKFEDGAAPAISVTEQPTQTPVGANGNNVDLRHEMVAAMQTQYSYQVVARAVTDHYNLLKTAAVEAK
jgi:flagellar basal-body rod protein FlgB